MELKPYYDVLVPGTYCCDIIFTGIPAFPALGTEIFCQNVSVIPGGTLNHIVALQRLGVNVGWVSALGSDFFSRFIGEAIQEEGIDLSLVKRLDVPFRHATVSLSFPQDRAFVSYADPSLDHVAMLFEVFNKVTFRHLHICHLELHERVIELIDACHAQGIQVSMDCQHQSVTLESPLVREVLSRVDIFMPNAGEAQKLACTDDVSDALDALACLVPYVVIKQGGQGAIARRNGVNYCEPALKLTPVDTTGAGDVFNAGFLAAHLEGRDTSTCLQWGNFCGGISTLGAGGTFTAPTRAQLDAWLSEQKTDKTKN